MSSKALLLKVIGKIYLEGDFSLITAILEIYSLKYVLLEIYIMSSINESKWSKCTSPLLSSRIFSISDAILFYFK